MMSEVQESVHTYVDEEGKTHCYERKIVSGDNKTEKNMHHGILRYRYRRLNVYKTAILVTSSLLGGRGVSQNRIPTLICCKFVEFHTFQTYNFEFKCPYHSRTLRGTLIFLIF